MHSFSIVILTSPPSLVSSAKELLRGWDTRTGRCCPFLRAHSRACQKSLGELGIDPSPRWSQHRVPSSNTSPPKSGPMLPFTPQDRLFTGGIEPPAGGSEPPVLPLHHANRQASARDRTWNARFKVLRDNRFHYRSGASPRIERGGLAPKASRLPLPHDAS